MGQKLRIEKWGTLTQARGTVKRPRTVDSGQRIRRDLDHDAENLPSTVHCALRTAIESGHRDCSTLEISSADLFKDGDIMSARASLAVFFVLFPLLSLAAEPQESAPAEVPSAFVLCYHIVESPQDERMEISRETFRQHLNYLEMTGYNVIPLRHLYEYVSGKRSSLPKNAIVITIDDGWRSTYTEAWPELQKRNMPFTVFLYPKIIGMTALAMTWAQVKEMAAAGVDIQSHSLSHPFLTRRRNTELDDEQYAEWLRRELVESRRILEKKTGQKVQFLAYPYGDYDTRVAKTAAATGYSAALTCDFGRVVKGSDPLRMKRVVIDKKMSFASFRRYLGNGSMMLAETTPANGQVLDSTAPVVVSAKIPNYSALDPASVGMALLSHDKTLPYSYDAASGAISVVVREEIEQLQGKAQRAVVWATDAKSGKRLEASWTFEVPDPNRPAPAPTAPAEVTAASVAAGSSIGGSSIRRAPR
jgi:peptidoglycan/xylan/chitin deacetylase (PgdA/CDA1 family)